MIFVDIITTILHTVPKSDKITDQSINGRPTWKFGTIFHFISYQDKAYEAFLSLCACT